MNYRAELVGAFGCPIEDNPTGVMDEAAFAAAGLNYRYLTIRVEKGTSVALSSIQAPSGSGKTKVTFSAPSGSKVKVWETEKEITFGSNGSVSADIIAVGEITL